MNTHIVLILDRSGSMQSIKADIIGGMNAFLDAQKKGFVTLVQFDDKYEVVYKGKSVKEAPRLTDKTFQPRGGTALYDAIGRTVNGVLIPDTDKAVFVILSDGEENASKEYTAAAIKELLRVNERYQFTFIGSNQDAILTARTIGIGVGHAINFANSSKGIQNVLRSASLNVSSYAAQDGQATMDSYTVEDRTAAVIK